MNVLSCYICVQKFVARQTSIHFATVECGPVAHNIENAYTTVWGVIKQPQFIYHGLTLCSVERLE